MDIEQARRCRRYIGRKELIWHLEGKRLTQRQIIQAKCFECCCGYSDGPYDCHIPACPLYPLMPFRGKEPPAPGKQGLEGGTDKRKEHNDNSSQNT